MKRGKKRVLGLFSAGLIMLGLMTFMILGLAGIALAADPQYGGILNTSWFTGPRFLDPDMVASPEEYNIMNNTYSTLLRWNKDVNDIELDLAESWRKQDDLTYIFTLRKGVRFHNIPPVNGREVTSEDVKYSIERAGGMYGDKTLFINRSDFEGKIASIATPDKYTVVIKSKEPYAPLLYYLSGPTAFIKPREAVEQFGDLKKDIIGTGPFMLKEYVLGSHIRLVRNPNYFRKGLPYLDEVYYRIMPDGGSVLAAFLAGDLDFTMIPYFQIETIKEKAPNTKVLKQTGWRHIVLRVAPWTDDHPLKPPFDNLKIRQALAMAIDKERLVKVAWDGYGDISTGPVTSFPEYKMPERYAIGYNPQQAKKLLAEAGYPNGFSAELLTWNEPVIVKAVQVVQAMLKDVGINVDLKILERAQYYSRVYKYDYQLSLHTMLGMDDPDHALTPYFGRNATYYKWNNKEIWNLIDEQNRITDHEKRKAKIVEAQRKIVDDAPNVFIAALPRFVACQPWVFPQELRASYSQMYSFEDIWKTKK